jgi:nucleoside-diphosphate-sugar epimerase
LPRTLISGIAGFTGRYLAERLIDDGHEIHGLVHELSSDGILADATLHSADLTNPDALSRVVADVQPDHVVHLAAIAFVAHRDVDLMYRTNIVGTRNLLEALKGVTAIRSILIASSANIYGNRSDTVFVETDPPAPANDYGVSKVATELVASLYAERLPIIVSRPFNYTGVGQSTDFLIPKIVESARKQSPVLELGNLDVERDFSDVRTVVDAYARLIRTPSAIGETFNVSSGNPVALRSIVDQVRHLSGHNFDIRTNPTFIRPNEVKRLSGSAAKLESVIGRLNRIPLEDTLSWMIEG